VSTATHPVEGKLIPPHGLTGRFIAPFSLREALRGVGGGAALFLLALILMAGGLVVKNQHLPPPSDDATEYGNVDDAPAGPQDL
jgi:hypothetical protein